MNPLRRPFRFRYYNVTLFIIGINILVYLAKLLFPGNFIEGYLSLSVPGILSGCYWQFLSYMFVHHNITHILFNMFALFVFGFPLEKRLGSWEFLCYYLVTGILAGAFSFLVYMFTGQYMVFLMGASGAIFAVQLAFATFFPGSVIYIWGLIPIKAPIMVLLFTGIEIFSMIAGSRSGRGDNVAHLTHLAGFAFGWLYFIVRFGINPWNSLFRRRP